MHAVIHYSPPHIRSKGVFKAKDSRPALKAFYNGEYTPSREIAFPDGFSLSDVPHECYDLTNNPMRNDESIKRAGVVDSLISGEIVIVTGEVTETWLCLSFGWMKVE